VRSEADPSGDRWEHLFHVGDLALRAYSDQPHDGGEYWLELAPRDVWVFPDAIA